MLLFVTVGHTEGFIEKIFDIPDGLYATYLGLEIEVEDKDKGDDAIKRACIVRVPFVEHKTGIHTMCQEGTDEIVEVEQ